MKIPLSPLTRELLLINDSIAKLDETIKCQNKSLAQVRQQIESLGILTDRKQKLEQCSMEIRHKQASSQSPFQLAKHLCIISESLYGCLSWLDLNVRGHISPMASRNRDFVEYVLQSAQYNASSRSTLLLASCYALAFGNLSICECLYRALRKCPSPKLSDSPQAKLEAELLACLDRSLANISLDYSQFKSNILNIDWILADIQQIYADYASTNDNRVDAAVLPEVGLRKLCILQETFEAGKITYKPHIKSKTNTRMHQILASIPVNDISSDDSLALFHWILTRPIQGK